MKSDSPSLTAYRVALSRAAHQFADSSKILDDPIALRIIGKRAEAGLRISKRLHTPSATYLRAFVVARSRIAEDALAAAVARGVTQYVILGAGLDTFAYRNPYPLGTLRVFEVDHPATQHWKRAQLKEGGIALPDTLSFVDIDFETQTLADRLQAAGFRSDQPAYFSWLGVTMYLRKETVLDTLRHIVAATPAGSEIVFDYATPLSQQPFLYRMVFRLLAYRLAAIGEPWQTFFDPDALAAELESIGFTHIDHIAPDAINRRFYTGRNDRLKVSGIGHLMHARR